MDDTKWSRFGSYRETGAYTRGFWFVILISSVSTIVTPLEAQRMSGQSIISKEIMGRQQDQRDDSSLLSCLMAYIEDYFDMPDWVSIVLPDDLGDIPDLTELFMSELRRKGKAVYTLNVGNLSVIKTYDGAADPIILAENASVLEGKDICLANHCKHDCDFMIVLTMPFDDEESFLAEVDKLTQGLCLRSIFELVILALVGDSAVIAGSPSSRIDGLYTIANATVLGRCVQGDAGVIQWQHEVSRNGTGLPFKENVINVGAFMNLPYTKMQLKYSGNMTFGGIEGRMVEQIARSIDVQLNREIIKWTNKTIIQDELKLRLHDKMSSDLVLGGLLWDNDLNVEYTNSYGLVSIKWLVPIHMNISMRGLIMPFRWGVWLSIIGTLILGGLVKHFLIRDTTFLDLASLFLCTATNRQPVRTSGRIQFISWALFGFFITQFYLGSLADQLMNASAAQMENMDELIESDLQIGGTEKLVNLLDSSDDDDEDDDNVRQVIREKYVIFEEDVYIKHMADIIKGKKRDLALLVMLNLTNIHKMVNVGHGHIMKETMTTYPLGFATWRGFPYLKDINFKIQMLRQTGIVQFMSEIDMLNTDNYDDSDDENNNIDIMDIAPAFLLLIMGLGGGCLLFIVEILFYPSPYLL